MVLDIKKLSEGVSDAFTYFEPLVGAMENLDLEIFKGTKGLLIASNYETYNDWHGTHHKINDMTFFFRAYESMTELGINALVDPAIVVLASTLLAVVAVILTAVLFGYGLMKLTDSLCRFYSEELDAGNDSLRSSILMLGLSVISAVLSLIVIPVTTIGYFVNLATRMSATMNPYVDLSNPFTFFENCKGKDKSEVNSCDKAPLADLL